MNVLVTGASGFVGQAFCKEFSEILNVTALSRQGHNLFNSNVKVYDGSYCSIVEALQGVDVVIHLATFYVAKHRSSDIDNIIEANIGFGVKLLEAMSEAGVSKIVNVGTIWQSYNGISMHSANLYAASKQSFQCILDWYSREFNFSVINLHLNDTFGENDPRKKLIQLLFDSALNGKALDMSMGEQKLELTYINDVTSALFHASKLLHSSQESKVQTFSLLTGVAYDLREIVSIIENVLRKKIQINWGALPYRSNEQMHPPYQCYSLLPGWKPKYSFEMGVQKMSLDN